MFACMTQLDEVSFRAVTSTEYRWATVTLSKSIGDFWTSVYDIRISTYPNLVNECAYPIGLDDCHIMAFNPKEERRERRHINHTQTIGLSWDEWQSGIFVEAYSRGHGVRIGPRYRGEVRRVLRKIYQTRVY